MLGLARLHVCLLAGFTLLLAAWLLDRWFPPPIPGPGEGAATLVLAADGTPLRAFADAEGVWRYPVTPEEVSPLYLEALLAYEDRWFYRHPGINPLAMLRASGQALRHRQIISGGSTLTMQVARLIEPIPHTLTGKLLQMIRALQLERRLTKREILSLYLNYAPFGGTLQGVGAASHAYLGKPPALLSHAEAALLAVLPQAPSRLRPDRHPERARQARDKVLERLAAQRTWGSEVRLAASQEAVVARRLQTPLQAALAAEYLRRRNPGTPRIQSTIIPDLQAQVEARVADWVRRLPARTSAAVVIVENRTMRVRAYVGTARFGDAESFGHLDMARAWRSPGSTLKPFLYGLALDAGLIHSESLLVDAPQSFDGYRPGNFDQAFSGPVSARDALQRSLNVPAVALLDALGAERFAARMAHAGAPLRLPYAARPNLSMILGGTEARLLDLVGAYAALQREGLAAAPRLDEAEPLEERRLLSPGAAWVVREMLRDGARPDAARPYLRASQRAELAWKTGTSYGFRDAWAIGAAPGATLGVWIGRPDGTPLPGQYGAVTALPLLFALHELLPREMRAHPSARPAGIEAVEVCWPLGLRASQTRPEHCERRFPAWAVGATVPPTLPSGGRPAPMLRTIRIDAASGEQLVGRCRAREEETLVRRASWPSLAVPWLTAAERHRAEPPPMAADCERRSAPAPLLEIVGITDGAVLRAPPNRAKGLEISVRALGGTGALDWLLDGRLVAHGLPARAVRVPLEEHGEHQLLAIDAQGRYARLRLTVEP